MTRQVSPQTPQILLSSAGKSWDRLEADFLHVPRGKALVTAGKMHLLGIHYGPPVNADCSCGGQRMRRVQLAGDIDVVPAGAEGSWEDDRECRILRLRVHPSLIEQVAVELGMQAGKTRLQPNLQLRDNCIAALGGAIKAALETSAPSDSLYVDLLGQALAVRLLETACGGSPPPENRGGAPTFSTRQMRSLTEFVESNLDQKLRLADLAKVIGVSVTRLKILFHNTQGMSVHQYVIRRRVETARTLLSTTKMSAGEIAISTGFSHQSHMASTMRRLLGRTPSEVIRQEKIPGRIC